VTHAAWTKILTPLDDGPRPLAKLLGTTDNARLEEVGDYLTGAGLAYVSVVGGGRAAQIMTAGRLFLAMERRRQ
jgi:hypothetical protein